MNLGNFKYKSLLFGVGATLLSATSCKDFLDVDIYDQYSASSINSKEAINSLANPLYGGFLWSQYEGKFSWCVNEGIPGILFNVNDQEGALFLLSIGEDNTILKEGYQSLYSGVIAHANQTIHLLQNKLFDGDLPSGVTPADCERVIGEARLFRAYAHFLATEYFGEVPLVWNTGKDIADNVTLPRVSRRTIYEACKQDLTYAQAVLPPDNGIYANWYSATALLGKLYLTMASCATPNTPGIVYPYVCEDPLGYLSKADSLFSMIIDKKGEAALDTHEHIFSAEGRQAPSSETLLALYWKMGPYGEGSQYQAQMAMSGDWSPGSGWGSGKGFTYTLFNSFSDDDARKKELCFYVGKGTGMEYTRADGDKKKAWIGSDYVTKKETGDYIGMSGKEFLSQGQHLLNNVKKYVWGVNGTSAHGSGMSIDRRQDLIRLSDVFMMRAEARMLTAVYSDPTIELTQPYFLADINAVLKAHGAPEINTIAYFQDFESKHQSHEKFTFNCTVDDGNGGSTQKAVEVEFGVPMFHGEVRSDLVQQRRKEFAMEGQAWLDLKRFYYLNPTLANKFLYQMDRGCQFTNSPELPEGDARFENETGYQRLALVNLCNRQLAAEYNDKGGNYKEGDPEVTINTETFIAKNRWFLPIPSSAAQYLDNNVQDLYDQVVAGTYQY